MKTNPLGVLLTVLLVLTTLATAGLFFGFLQSARKLPPLQTEVMIINRNQAAVQGLLSEAMEFSKRDTSIEPLLQSMGIRPRTNLPSTSARSGSK